MAKRIEPIAAVLALALAAPAAFAQTTPAGETRPAPESAQVAPAVVSPAVTVQTVVPQVPASVTVQQLAPQLLAFAGSSTNFQSLVNGLALGLPVTLVSVTPDGLTQTVTFTPTGAMAAVDVARILEQARQNLIARGIATPTAQQLAVILAGGTLPTTLGGVPVVALVPVVPAKPAAPMTPASASTGSSTSVTPLTVQTVPGAALLPGIGTTVVTTPGTALGRVTEPRFTSDSPSIGTSDTPLPFTSTTPAVTSGTGSTSPNGPPSPAARLQGQR